MLFVFGEQLTGEQEWRSSGSSCLSPLWPGFDSGRGHMWVEFVVGSQLALRVFLWHENQLRLINASSSLNSVMYLSIVLFFRPLSRILRKSEKKRTMS